MFPPHEEVVTACAFSLWLLHCCCVLEGLGPHVEKANVMCQTCSPAMLLPSVFVARHLSVMTTLKAYHRLPRFPQLEESNIKEPNVSTDSTQY